MLTIAPTAVNAAIMAVAPAIPQARSMSRNFGVVTESFGGFM
jgi:hypothetical protein